MAIFWGIGVGPGHPDWLTLQGLSVLQSVPIIACPQNRQGQPGLAYKIVAQHLLPHQQVVSLELPFVNEPEILTAAWQRATDQVLKYLQSGLNVAFISEGDISLYSTFTYLAKTLHQSDATHEIRAVPGVCSPLAATACLGQPLATGAEKIAILPAMYCVSELDQILQWADQVVLMKVASVFPQIWHYLAQTQRLQQASLIIAVGQDHEQIWPTLEHLKTFQPPYFSLLIIRNSRSPYTGTTSSDSGIID